MDPGFRRDSGLRVGLSRPDRSVQNSQLLSLASAPLARARSRDRVEKELNVRARVTKIPFERWLEEDREVRGEHHLGMMTAPDRPANRGGMGMPEIRGWIATVVAALLVLGSVASSASPEVATAQM